MKYIRKRMVAVLLCLSMLVSFVIALPPTEAQAKNYGEYEDVAKVYDQGSCPSMQGMSVHGNYVYACKINGDTETSAVVARVHKDTGSTSNAISGIDWVFSYMGTYRHSYNASLEYLQIWESGKPGNELPQNYHWETAENMLVNLTEQGSAANPAAVMTGSCDQGVYSAGQYALQRSVVLCHDRNWSIEWHSEGKWSGGGMLLSSAISGYSTNVVYLLRSSKAGSPE